MVDKDDDICGVIQSIEPFHVLILRDNGDLITYPNSLILQKAVIKLAEPGTATGASQASPDRRWARGPGYSARKTPGKSGA